MVTLRAPKLSPEMFPGLNGPCVFKTQPEVLDLCIVVEHCSDVLDRLTEVVTTLRAPKLTPEMFPGLNGPCVF